MGNVEMLGPVIGHPINQHLKRDWRYVRGAKRCRGELHRQNGKVITAVNCHVGARVMAVTKCSNQRIGICIADDRTGVAEVTLLFTDAR